MKFKILLFLLSVTLHSFSQVSVGPRHVGTSSKFKKGDLEKFKNTETIFILSDIYEKEIYTKVIEDSWDVTPFKIVDYKSLNIDDYLNGKYSFAEIAGRLSYRESTGGGTSTFLITYLDFKMYDNEAINKQKDKLSREKWRKKREDILDKNASTFARFNLYQKDDFLRIAIPNVGKVSTFGMDRSVILSEEYMDDVIEAMYSKDVFFNYKPGFLKNYFQKINELLKAEEVYWMFAKDFTPELKNLTKTKLYVPSYISIKMDRWKVEDSEENDENIDDIFGKYDFEYEIILDEELNDKIINNEELYYLRYVRMNSEQFIQVINSKSGDIIYRDYIGGRSFKIKSKHINELNDKIIKASKK